MRHSLKVSLAGVIVLSILATLAPTGAAVSSQQVIRFHGGGYDSARAIAVDSAGNVYLGASVDTEGTPVTFAVVKLSPEGSLLWRRTYSGSRGGVGGEARAVTVDAAGNVYAVGYVHDGVIFNQNYDYLVVKLGPDGTERWAQRYNGPGDNADFAERVAVDAAGNVYTSGFSYGQDYDWATLKYDPAGTLVWERRHSGPVAGDDRVADMAFAPSGNLVVTGVTRNTGDGQTGDIETLTYDPQGAVAWQRRWTATTASHELPRDMDIDPAGQIAITGTTAENASPYAVPFPVTLRYTAAGALLQTIQGEGAGGESVDLDSAGNVYLAGALAGTPGGSGVARYGAAGERSWLTPLALEPGEGFSLRQVAADSVGNVTVAGSGADISTGERDYLTIRYAADGTELWRHRFDGTADGDDRVAGLAIDGTDAALVTGTSWSGYLSAGGTADDIVTLKFAAGAVPPLVAPSNLSATGISKSAIQLRWQDNAGTESGFRVERCLGVGCTSFAQVATLGRDVTSYIDSGLARKTQYTYRVQAFNASDISPYSNTSTAKTQPR